MKTDDLLHEDLIPITNAAAHFPVRPHRATLHRWRMHGVDGYKLETIKIGGRVFTSREAIERFKRARDAVTAQDCPTPDTGPATASELARSARSRTAVERDLKKKGML
ncbi:DUF1580 domain-containing protein [Maioricimonas sp. JC845]|uniref:DUF1580 domain-containing protein n=1 Tax=Maioricimonas sp. JC845 TaxID=3232138 RepID=UPI003457CC7B